MPPQETALHNRPLCRLSAEGTDMAEVPGSEG